jgi:hypothetical protein
MNVGLPLIRIFAIKTTIMKYLLNLFILVLLIKPCLSQDVKDLVTTNYISLTVPQDYEGKINYLNSSDVIEKKNVGEVKHDNSILQSFPNLVSTVTLYQVDKDGSLSLLGNSLSAKKSTYVVIYDYTQTQTIQYVDNSGKLTYYALIGVSVRMVARVNTKTSGINLANLYGLGIAANNKKVTGSLEVRANGINSQQINGIIPVTTDLSPSSIANALQAVATIKSHIYDKETKITPQFLAFSAIGNTTDKIQFKFENLLQQIQAE